jgi:hypothetical protein
MNRVIDLCGLLAAPRQQDILEYHGFHALSGTYDTLFARNLSGDIQRVAKKDFFAVVQEPE